MCTLGEEQRTSAFSGMAPFVAILGLISICKRDNCSHMEAIDRRGQCNFFQRGDEAQGEIPLCSNLSWHRKKQNLGFRQRNSFKCSDSLIHSPANNYHPTPLPNPLPLSLMGSGDMMLSVISLGILYGMMIIN